MLRTLRGAAPASFVLLTTLLATAPPARAGRASALAALAARAQPVASVAPGEPASRPGLRAPAGACPGGQHDECFEIAADPEFVSVATFFDRRRLAGLKDYMVKYFEP